MWERTRPRRGHYIRHISSEWNEVFADKSAPTVFLRQARLTTTPEIQCGSGLVREEADAGDTSVPPEKMPSRTSRSHSFCVRPDLPQLLKFNVGADSSAKRSAHSIHPYRLYRCLRGQVRSHRFCGQPECCRCRQSLSYMRRGVRGALLLL